MSNELAKKLFDMWMGNNHPWFYIIAGLFTIFFILAMAFSVVAVLWADWWWKALLVSTVGLGLTKFISFLVLSMYVEEWKSRK